MLVQKSTSIVNEFKGKSIINKFVDMKEEILMTELFSKVRSAELETEFNKCISDNMLSIMFAGTDTTKGAISSMIDLLADNK